MSQQIEGTVIGYVEKKGFGWISKGEDAASFEKLFFHIRHFVGEGIPKEGQPVLFEIQPYRDGPLRRALNITPR
jgi:cold shock CspA family protein